MCKELAFSGCHPITQLKNVSHLAIRNKRFHEFLVSLKYFEVFFTSLLYENACISLVLVLHPFPPWEAWPHNPYAALMLSASLCCSVTNLCSAGVIIWVWAPQWEPRGVPSSWRRGIRTQSTAFSRKLGFLSWQCRLWTASKAIFCTLVPLSTNPYSNSFKIMRYQCFLNFYLSATVTEITSVALLMICINQSKKEIRSLKYLEV